jgi:hypothetical protein
MRFLFSLLLVAVLEATLVAQAQPLLSAASRTVVAASEARSGSATLQTPTRSAVFNKGYRTNNQAIRVAAAEESQSTPKPSLSAIKSTYHGNSNASNKPQSVYLLAETNKRTGQTLPYKVGISGRANVIPTPLTRSITVRALSQARSLNSNPNRATNFPGEQTRIAARNLIKVDSGTLGRTTRETAKALEQRFVTQFAAKHGKPPPGNQLPKPLNDSQLSRNTSLKGK